jgi:predicted RNA-binding protein (virulence factor B family)
LKIGVFNKLKVNREVDFGLYLIGGEGEEILLPKKYIPENTKLNDELDVFVYLDSEDRKIATTEKPYAIVGEFANLKVAQISKHGAFLEWGLQKDLFVPFREQLSPLKEGQNVIVYIYLDKITQRIVASTKLDKFIKNISENFKPNVQVSILVYKKTEMGFATIVNNSVRGMIFKQDIHQHIEIGQKLTAYIKKVRDDGKIDLTLQRKGYGKVAPIGEKILDKLQKTKFLAMNDKSSPEEIKKVFGVSKNSFKQALGKLYKEKKIAFEKNGIKLVSKV